MSNHRSNQIPIAVVGMGCRLPGADGLEEFWQLLLQGRDAVQDLPDAFLDRNLYYDQQQGVRGKTYSLKGGLVKNRPLNLELCPLSPRDQQNADPAHLILCEVAASACRHAGYDPRELNVTSPNTGVFIGHSAGSNFGSEIVFASLIGETLEYLREVPEFARLEPDQQDRIIVELTAKLQADRPSRNRQGGPALGPNAAASLIARTLKLNGPHLVTDAACASSLMALAIGAHALQQGEIDLAIVGGASYNKPESLILFSHARSCSATGSRPFDDNADGLISSEGYVALLLKTLPRAMAAGDVIHAVIPGLGISTDGRGRSLWAPRKEGQVESMRRAYGQHLDPSEIDFIEAHATSTQVGDATELEAIAEFFGPHIQRSIPIGSVKSNIGHTLETAGVAGLLKTILAIQHGTVPPTINVQVPNRTVPWHDLPFRIATEPQPLLPHADRPRRAAVNAFGIGGLNVHVVVDEYTSHSATRYGSAGLPVQSVNSSTTSRSAASSSPTGNPIGRLPASEARATAESASALDAIAIIGRGNILPGAKNIAEFSALIHSGQSMISEAPPERWRNLAGVQPAVIAPRKTPHSHGGFITDYEFDWLRYRIPPKQIANSNPLQFMLLDAARQALSEAGFADQQQSQRQFDRSTTGVVVGTMFGGEFGHQLLMGLRLPEIIHALTQRLNAQQLSEDVVRRIVEDFRMTVIKYKPAIIDETGSFTSSTLASRVSKELNLMGGAMAIDAGECSSLAALNVSINLLRSGACSQVLCAAAQRSMDLANFETLALQHRLSGSDREHPQAGFNPGEGVAMVLLKPLAQAQRDGNPIFGIIRSVGGAYDPIEAQTSIELAHARASRRGSDSSKQVQRVVSGSNCLQSDSAERATLNRKFNLSESASQTDSQTRLISQIGNLQGASGLTSLLRETIDARANQLTALNNLSFCGQDYLVLFEPKGNVKLSPPTTLHPPEAKSAPAVQSQPAATKATATIGLRAAPVTRTSAATESPMPLPAMSSQPTLPAEKSSGNNAPTEVRIYRFAASDAALMDQKLNAASDHLDATLAKAAQPFQAKDRFRLAIVAGSPTELAQKLKLAAKQWQQPSAQAVLNAKGVFSRDTNLKPRRVAFVFPGQGSQYPGMLKGLLATSAAAQQTMTAADRILEKIGSRSFADIAWSESAELHNDLWKTQVSVLLADIFVCQALRKRGLNPDCVCGHSFGEIPAMFAAGALSLEQAILLTRKRSEAIQGGRNGKALIQCGLLSLQASAERTESLLQQFHSRLPVAESVRLTDAYARLYVTHCNAPQQTVVGGRVDLLAEFAALLARDGIAGERLNVPQAFHTPLMRGARDCLARTIPQISIRPPERLILSGVRQRYVADPEDLRQQLLDQMTSPVQHVDLLQRLVRDGFGIMIEVGPQRVLTGLHRQICQSQNVLCVATDHPRQTASPTSAHTQLLYIQAIMECEGIAALVDTSPIRHSGINAPEKPDNMIQRSTIDSTRKMLRCDATLPRRERQRQQANAQLSASALDRKTLTGPARFDATENRRQRVRGTSLTNSHGNAVTTSSPDLELQTPSGHSHLAGPASSNGQIAGMGDDALQSFLVDFIVEQTGYPAEIIDIDWEFEADLGIDSIKKAQLFGELRELFDLDAMASQFMTAGKFSLDKFRTLRDVLELLRESGGKSEWLKEQANREHLAPASPDTQFDATSYSAPTDFGPSIQPSLDPTSERMDSTEFPTSAPTVTDGLENFLIDFVIEQTGYPREIIELDADFEADLGIDSIKKAQLFGELREHFSLSIDQFSRIDRVSFGKIRTLRDVMMFLRSLPEFNPEILPTEAPRLIGSSVSPQSETRSLPADTRSQVIPATREPAQSDFVNGSGSIQQHPDYIRGLQRGKDHVAEIRSLLRASVDSYSNVLSTRYSESARDIFTEGQLAEIQGLADGAGVHPGGIVASNLAALERVSTGFSEQTDLHTDAACLLVEGLVVPSKTLPEEIACKEKPNVTSRYVLRTTLAPQSPTSPVIPELNGAAIILGTNEVALALESRIQQLGQPAFCIEPTSSPAVVAELERIWNEQPAPHLFIVTARDSDAQTTGSHSQWKIRRDKGLMIPFWLCQKWIQLVQANSLMDDASLLAVISSGGDLGFTAPVHAIESGGVSGLLKSILIESWVNGYRTTPIKILDAKPGENATAIADAVMRELANPNYDTEITWNGGQRAKVQARIVEIPHNRSTSNASHTQMQPIGGHWLCTGGARGITAFVCSELANRYNLSLSLIGVSAKPDIPADWHDMSESQCKQLKLSVMMDARAAGKNPIKAWEQTEKEIEIDKNLRELQAAGIRVHYYSCDVADHAQLERVLQRVRETSGPIDAVLHGAGIGKDTRFENKDPEKVDLCIRAKVDGALALMELTRTDPLKYFVAFGSISGRFGANGHTDYSLANEMLAKTIGWYRDQRPEVGAVAFHWHAWGDVGMATRPETRLALEMIDMDFMPAREGLDHLINELQAGVPEREVLITDDRYYRLFFPAESLAVSSEENGQPLNSESQYPLLDRGESAFQDGQLIVSVPLNPTTDPFLKEHRLDDRPLLPIVIGLELLAEAGAKQLQTSQYLELRDIEALNGLRFHGDGIQIARVQSQTQISEKTGLRSLANQSPQQATCCLLADFHSRSGQLVEADRPYLQGLVCAAKQAIFQRPAGTPVPPGPWHPVKYPAPGEKFYLGPVLQRLRKIKIEGKTAWGRIVAPAAVELAGPRQSVTGWLVPSAALDACLFATGLLAWFTIEPGTALPAGIGRLTLGRMPFPGEPCLVETTFQRRDGRYVYFNFSLYGNDGDVIAEVDDYRIVWLSE